LKAQDEVEPSLPDPDLRELLADQADADGADDLAWLEPDARRRLALILRRGGRRRTIDQEWWRRRESFGRVLLSHRNLRENMNRQKRQTV
jgi:hypothetical protein